MSELLKRLEMERMQGNFALNNYPNDEYWVNWDELVNVFEEYAQPQLNENQQIVLEWLKEYMLDDSDFYNTVYASKQLYSYGVPYGEESEAFTKLNNRELAQVLELFSKWAQEQEEE
ncbi:hypothetical protein [Enterococcus gallinarum]|uniref:hypothetical protein n=1 Tax=Enterococcus gallinarum TaxID=1353 RepID=UPI0032E0474E